MGPKTQPSVFALPVSGADVAKQAGKHAHFVPDRAELITALKAVAQPGDVVVCMTVSGYESLAEELAEKLNS